MNEPNAFDVFSYMSRAGNMALRLAPLSNVASVNYNHKRGTEILIGFPGNIAFEFTGGKLVGGLLLVNKDEFEKAKKEAFAEQKTAPAQLSTLRERVLRNAKGIDRALTEGQDPVELLQNLKLALLASVELE